MPTRYFAGNTMAAFARTSVAVVEDTTANTFDSSYVSNSINAGTDNTGYAESAPFSATGIFWTRFDIYIGGSTTSASGPMWVNGSTGVFMLECSGTGNTFQPKYWNGSAWTSTGTTFSLNSSTRYQLDVKLDLSTGAFECYQNKVTLVSSGSGWSGYGTTVTNWRGYPTRTATRYSQVMIADYDLRESKLMTTTINGNGTYTDGTGSYTDIDEATLDDGDSVYVTNVGDKKGFTKSGITVPSGFIIAGMVANVRGRVSTGTITDGKIGVLSSSSVNLSAAKSFAGIYSPRCHIVSADPNTATEFTQTGFNNAEVYIQAS